MGLHLIDDFRDASPIRNSALYAFGDEFSRIFLKVSVLTARRHCGKGAHSAIDLETPALIEFDLSRAFQRSREQKQDFEKPTIGILLCKEKNDALVELTLPKDANIYASAYQLYLPNKALLQAKVKEWIEEFEENEELKKLEEHE